MLYLVVTWKILAKTKVDELNLLYNDDKFDSEIATKFVTKVLETNSTSFANSASYFIALKLQDKKVNW